MHKNNWKMQSIASSISNLPKNILLTLGPSDTYKWIVLTPRHLWFCCRYWCIGYFGTFIIAVVRRQQRQKKKTLSNSVMATRTWRIEGAVLPFLDGQVLESFTFFSFLLFFFMQIYHTFWKSSITQSTIDLALYGM